MKFYVKRKPNEAVNVHSSILREDGWKHVHTNNKLGRNMNAHLFVYVWLFLLVVVDMHHMCLTIVGSKMVH